MRLRILSAAFSLFCLSTALSDQCPNKSDVTLHGRWTAPPPWEKALLSLRQRKAALSIEQTQALHTNNLQAGIMHVSH